MNLINLEKVKKTRIELAGVVARHPRLCEGSGTWGNDLNQLENMIMATQKERMEKYRNKMLERGLKPITAYLTQEAQTVLNRLQYERKDATIGDIVSESLVKTGQVGKELTDVTPSGHVEFDGEAGY